MSSYLPNTVVTIPKKYNLNATIKFLITVTSVVKIQQLRMLNVVSYVKNRGSFGFERVDPT